MESFLDNPVFSALKTGDASFSIGSSIVKYFDEAMSPFAGFEEGNKNGFPELYQLLPAGRRILYATRKKLSEPEGWQMMAAVDGLQFLFTSSKRFELSFEPIPLSIQHVPQMIELTALTKPGPFGEQTIKFGYYYGIFEQERLVAMTGQRLHAGPYTEISAVCTHPDFLGKGYAGLLIQHQLNLIQAQGNTPYLHVRADNSRAISLYERLGFTVNGPMNFFFMKKK